MKKHTKKNCRRMFKKRCRKGTFVLFRISYIDNSNPIFKEIADPVKQYSGIEDIEREEIMKNGGSISYHYGVGRLRKQFVQKYIGDTGNRVIKECQVTN